MPVLGVTAFTRDAAVKVSAFTKPASLIVDGADTNTADISLQTAFI